MLTPLFQLEYSLGGINDAVAEFWQKAHTYKIMAFSGQLGAGKTTFIHALCDHLGVTDAVSSPTFALINEYHFTDSDGADNKIYHMDWYRLRDEEEAIQAGMEDSLLSVRDDKTYCFVEWPEKASGLLARTHLYIDIQALTEKDRRMQVSVFTKG